VGLQGHEEAVAEAEAREEAREAREEAREARCGGRRGRCGRRRCTKEVWGAGSPGKGAGGAREGGEA
jgi:hypothetical protein